MAVLDDALLLLAEGVALSVRPAPAIVAPTRSTVGSFLGTLSEAFIEEADAPPPLPDLKGLTEAGIPVVEDGSAEAAAGASHRRRLLLGLVRDAGWEWGSAS